MIKQFMQKSFFINASFAQPFIHLREIFVNNFLKLDCFNIYFTKTERIFTNLKINSTRINCAHAARCANLHKYVLKISFIYFSGKLFFRTFIIT